MKKNIAGILGLFLLVSGIVAFSQASNDPRMAYHAYLTKQLDRRSNDVRFRIKSETGGRQYRPFSMKYGEVKNFAPSTKISRQTYTVTEDKTIMKTVANELFALQMPAIWLENYEDGAFLPQTSHGIHFEAKMLAASICENQSFDICARNIIRTQNTMINSSKRNSAYYRKYPDRIKTYTHNRLTDQNSIFKFENLSGIYNEKRRYINESRDTMTVFNRQKGFTEQHNLAFYEESQIALNMGQEEFITQRVMQNEQGDILFVEISVPNNQADPVISLAKRIFSSVNF